MKTKTESYQPDANDAQASSADMVTIRPKEEVMTIQSLPYFVGVGGETAGATGISMNLVVIPAGGAADAHLHRGYETAIYMLKGRVKTYYGPGLKKTMINEEGDFIFIPADVPHHPHNLSDTEPALAIVARNDPNEQESVVHYAPEG
jgi:uncharacterized RmlC-like cupin family protein